MNRLFACGVFAMFVSVSCLAQSASEPALPYSPSLNVTSMDKSVDPCVDFYTYSCGGWQNRNPIPPEETSWGVYGKLYQDNLQFLRGILTKAAATTFAARLHTVPCTIGEPSVRPNSACG